MVGYRILYWASTIRPEDRSSSNYTDTPLLYNDAARLAVIALKERGCTFHTVRRVEMPSGRPLTLLEWLALPYMSSNELRCLRQKQATGIP